MTKLDIQEYLIENKDRFKQENSYRFDLRNQLYKTENRVFHDDIKNNCDTIIRMNICDDVCENLGVDYESVYVILEDINMEEYLK